MPWFVLILVALFVVVVVGLTMLPSPGSADIERIDFLTVEPRFVCPTASCAVDIGYTVTTTHDNTQVVFRVVGPAGTTQELSRELTFSQALTGSDATLWMDGPGEYRFILEVAGDQVGTTAQAASTTLFAQEDGVISHQARVDMRDAINLNVAEDSFRLAELHQLKIPEYTLCEKSADLTSVRYVGGGLSGHNRNLSVTILDGGGAVVFDVVDIQPGVEIKVQPPLHIAGGLQVNGVMVGGFTGTPPTATPTPFLQSDVVPWELVLGVHCRP